MSVLVATPVSDENEYCLDIFTRQLCSFDYVDYDTYLIDYSKDPLFIEYLYNLGLNAERIKPEGNIAEYLCECYNAIRDKVLYDGYEWLFLLDSNVFVPLNIITYLVKQRNLVHTFAYYINDESAKCLRFEGENSEELIGDYYKPISECRIGMDFDVYSVGLGCTFIHRNVLEQINFRTDGKAGCDYFFYQDIKGSNTKPVIDTNIIPAHYRSESFVTDLKIIQ